MFKTIQVGLVLHTGQFGHGLRSAAGDVRQFGREVNQVATRTDQAARQTVRSAGLVATAVGTTLAAGLALSTRSAMAFERELRNVNSISRMSEAQLASTGRAVLDLSRTLPQSATTLAKGLYDIASSGFQGAQGLHILRTSAVAASAGLTDTATAARAITAVLNAYGLSAGRAGDVSDILFQTVNLGVVTFEELAGTVGDFVGSAAAARVPIDDASAALATMTLSGVDADEAGTSLNRTLQALIDPSETMARLLRSLGYESGIAALDALGLRGTMDLLRTATGGNIETLVKLFPEIRAARGALALMSAEGTTYARVAEEITDENKRAGAAQLAFNEQAKSASFQLEIAKNSIGALAIEVGQTFLPAVTTAANMTTGFVSAIGDLPGPVKSTGIAVGALAAPVLVTAGAFFILAPRLVATKTLLADLAVTAPRAAGAIGFMGGLVARTTPLLALASAGFAIYGQVKAEATQRTKEIVDALVAEEKGVVGATDAWVTKELVEHDAVSAALRLGLSISDVIGAVKGEEDAVRRLNEALADYIELDKSGGGSLTRQQELDLRTLQNRVLVVGEEYKGARPKAEQFAAAAAAAGTATKNTAGAAGQQSAAMAELDRMLGGAEGATRGLTDAQRELLSAVQGFIDPAGLLSDIESEKEQVRKRSTKTTESAVKKELELESAVLGVERANRSLAKAAEEVERLRAGVDMDAIVGAEREYADAVAGSEQAQRRLVEAEEDLARLRAGPDALTLEKAELDARQAEIGATRARADADAAETRVKMLEEWGATEEELAPAILDREEALIRAREAEIRAAEAQQRLNDVRDGASPEELADAERDLADAQRAAAGAASDVAERARELEELRSATKTDELADAELAYREALLAVRQAHEAVAEAQRQAKEPAEEFSRSIDGAKASLAEFERALRDEIVAQEDWERNLVTIAQRGGMQVAEEFRKLGRDHAGIVAQMANAGDTQFGRMAEVMKTKAELGSFEHYTALEKGLAIAAEKAKLGAEATADAIATALKVSVATVREIAAQYGIELSEGIKPIWKEVAPGVYREYVPGEGFTGTTSSSRRAMMAEGGVLNTANTAERHVAQIAPAGTWRVWAEPETGGEAYIPLSPSKRNRSVDILDTVARMFGYSLAEYRDGGFRRPEDVPQPPRFEMFGPGLSTFASGFTQFGYEMAVDIVKAAMSGGTVGDGWQSITSYLDRRMVPYRVTSTTGGRHVKGSLHYAGKAVDLVGSDMRRIFDTLAEARGSLAELFYTPSGYSIKNGRIVSPPIAAASHYDHVHAATFDNGGPLYPGLTLAYNGTGHTEWVDRGRPGLSVRGPLLQIDVRTDAAVDPRAMSDILKRSLEPALTSFVEQLDQELRGD